MSFNGRRQIFSDYDYVDENNVLDIVEKAFGVHSGNRSEIQYLYDYYRGNQPILEKIKQVRPEINNKVVVNRALEIVNFKVGYLLGEPIQYVARNDSDVCDAVNTLNDYVFAEDKASKDKELAEWFSICGTAYRLVLPDGIYNEEIDDSPFEIYTLDPRNTFVVYANSVNREPILGVTYVIKEDFTTVLTCYSKDTVYTIARDSKNNQNILKVEPHILGDIPIVEYPANSIRMGEFESVVSMLDAINQIESDRMDAVDQFVQALMIFKNVDIESEEFKNIRELGGMKVPADGDVSYLVQELNQQGTQILEDNMYQTVLSIVGMPSTSDGNTSDSSNNGAVLLRQGWQGAESRAKNVEVQFKRSEKQFLKVALRIASSYANMDLKLKDIDIRFTRRNYENLLVKSQVLTTMLANEKIHPRLAFEQCGMFTDCELAYTMSEEYAKEQEDKETESLQQFKTSVNVYDSQNSRPNPNDVGEM